jgi:hypothetical protein
MLRVARLRRPQPHPVLYSALLLAAMLIVLLSVLIALTV